MSTTQPPGFGPGKDIADLAQEHSLGQPGVVLNGPEWQRTSNLIRNELSTTSLIATMFWQGFAVLPAYGRSLEQLGIGSHPTTQMQTYVVCHGLPPRYDLLILDAMYEGEPVSIKSVQEQVRPAAVAEGWQSVYREWLGVVRSTGLLPPHWLFELSPNAAAEAARDATFNIVVARAPTLLPTATRIDGWSVASAQSGWKPSTAGVLAKDRSSRVGVTAARHAIGDQATRVRGDGWSGEVVASDALTDSSFIAFDDQVNGPPPGPPTVSLRVTPSNLETVEFHGVGSGRPMRTIVTGWSRELPMTYRWLQSHVTTKAVTKVGDSGAALWRRSGEVIGFALGRTGYDDPVEFAAWIWAESVFSALQLT